MQKENEEQIPDIEKEGWKAEKIIKEGANVEADEVVRRIKHGQTTENDSAETDLAIRRDQNSNQNKVGSEN
jgi:hypothetical protein